MGGEAGERRRAVETCAPRRRGRPRQIAPARRAELVLDAAAVLLAERRLEEVTMDAIAERAGMSKRTLYGLFDSREALLEACIGRMMRAIFRPLAPAARHLALAERLRLLLTLNSIPGSEAHRTELLRAIIAETRTFPALARRSCAEGREMLERNVAAELEIGLRRGEIALPRERIALAARLLVDMAFENPITRLLRPDLPPPDPEQTAARRELAVTMFLAGLPALAELEP